MIKVRSPYYKTVSFVSPLTGATCTQYTIKVRLWRGNSLDTGSIANYTLTRYNYNNSTGSEDVEVGSFAESEIENKVTTLSDGVISQDTANQLWMETIVVYTTANPADSGVDQAKEWHLCTRGYAYGNEGKNVALGSRRVLLSGNVQRASKKSMITIPVYTSWGDNWVSIESTPNNNYTKYVQLPETYNSQDIIKLITIDTSLANGDTRIHVNVGGYYQLIIIDDDEKNENTDVYFINKDGAQQTISMRGERVDSMNTKGKSYQSYSGQPSDGYHQFKSYLKNGKSRISLNSGHIPESQNEAFKELLLSENIWLAYRGEVLPATIKTSNIEYLTRAKDSVVRYAINFEFAYDEINTI